MLLAVNKCESPTKGDEQAVAFWELGIEPYPVSALSGYGTGDLLDTAIDAQKLITDAVAAAELADQLEADAEIALQVSEAMLAEHEPDFPE